MLATSNLKGYFKINDILKSTLNTQSACDSKCATYDKIKYGKVIKNVGLLHARENSTVLLSIYTLQTSTHNINNLSIHCKILQ